MTPEPLPIVGLLALTGIVIAISALCSGVLERRGISLVLVFLGLGWATGPHAFGIVEFTLDSPLLQIAATVSLTMVLFSDAVSVQPGDLRRHAGLAALILGPGTLLAAGLIAVAAWWLLDLPATSAAMVGAALASTDPVMLRNVLRDPKVPEQTRHALRLESSLNDAVLLPVILIALALASGNGSGPLHVIGSLTNLLVIGPAAGFGIGFALVLLLERVRSRFGVRRDYESLYALGIALTAFSVAEAIHASGYMAAFAAGLAIAFQDIELCDCFHDYGEATAEMALLLTFVALGGSLIWTGLELINGPMIAFVLIALLIRPVVLLLVVPRQQISGRDRWLLAWFGPRGLSSLLLILLPGFVALPGSARMFAICALVALASIVIHSFTPALLTLRTPAPPSDEPDLRISIPELKQLVADEQKVYLIDVRSDTSWETSDTMASGALRIRPSYVVTEARRMSLPIDAWIALYCT